MSTHIIEFIGGPFDGLLQSLNDPSGVPPECLVCIVSDNAFRLLNGQPLNQKCTVTSMAVYQRLKQDAVWKFYFVAAVSPDEAQVKPSRSNKAFGPSHQELD